MSGSGSANQARAERKKALMEVFAGMDEARAKVVERLVDEMVFLERSMSECRELPMIEVNSKGEQRMTPAWKIYKDSLSQYSNSVRILLGTLGKQGEEGKDSPLRAYFRELAKQG